MALKRTKPLKRSWLKRGRKRSAYSKRPRDLRYMGWVRQQECIVAEQINSYQHCRGPVHAHHAGPRAFGRKAPDDTCIPICESHHEDYHNARGYFAMSKQQRMDWTQEAIAETRSRWLASEGKL